MAASRIIIVDDHTMFREALRSSLETTFTNVDIEGAGSLDELEMKLAETKDTELILLDLKMPRLSGLAVLAKLKSNRETNAIPVVIVSAKSDSDSLMEGQRAGAADYLIKPFNIEQLRLVVQRQCAIRGD